MVRTEPTIKSMVVLSTVMLVSLGFMENCTQWHEARPGMIQAWEKKLKVQAPVRTPAAIEARLAQTLDLEVDPREVWLHCRRRQEPEVCYLGRLRLAFDRLAEPFFAGKKDAQDQARERFLQANSFAAVGEATEGFFRKVFAEALPLARESALKRRASCKSVPACVEQAAILDVIQVRDQFALSKEIELTDREAALYLRDLLLAPYREAAHAS